MIARLAKQRLVRVAALSVGAVAVAGAAVVVTAYASGMSFGFKPAGAAQSPVDAKTTSPVCATFMKHFAVEIGKSQAEIDAAFQKAIADTLADEVKSGQITQAQADALAKRFAGQTPCTLPSTVGRGGAGKNVLGAFMQQYLSAAAAALGIPETQLGADIKGGQSLSQVAAAQHVSEADFRSRLIANLKPALDQAVTSKKLTSAQEQSIINRLQTGPLPLWTMPAPRKPRPAAAATPSPA